MAGKTTTLPNKVELTPDNSPGFTHASNLTQESAKRTSDLLTKNHELYHTRWKATFHNHITHHLLALWALGATPSEIQDMYDYNAPYQAPVKEGDESTAEEQPYVDLTDAENFESSLGNNDRYADFLRFFEIEIAKKGAAAVVKEYVLSGTEKADDIFGRMYTDLVHPMIHLGCGIEFHQPSIIAEALAGACVHVNYPKTFLIATEKLSRSTPTLPSKPLLDVLTSMQNDPIVSNGVKDTDPFNKIPDGFLKRVTPEQLAPHLAQFQVDPTPEGLQRGLTDMMYTAAYALGAAQRPGKREAMDFVTLHAATLSVFYPAILAEDWLSNEEKARLLEAKARVDAVMYAGISCPTLYTERITGYKPHHPSHGWEELFQRSIVYKDEGHAAKMIRALYATEKLDTQPSADFPIQREDVIKVAHMAMDSIEGAFEEGGNSMPEHVQETMAKRIGFGGEFVVQNQIRWVFYGGLPKAWDFVPGVEVRP